MKKLIAVLLMLVLSLVVFAQAEEDSLEAGDIMPDFTVTMSDGRTFTLSELLEEKGMVLFNLWASWCPPCRAEFPTLQSVYDRNSDKLEVVALSIEEEDTDEVIESFKQELGLSTLPMGRDIGISEHINFEGIPTTLLIDRSGTIVFMHSGSITDEDTWEKLIDSVSIDDNAAGEPKNLYAVFMLNEDDEAVPGCVVQFCSDTTCELLVSNEEGAATLIAEPYPYEIHMLSVPEGYVKPDDVFRFDVKGAIVYCLLEKNL